MGVNLNLSGNAKDLAANLVKSRRKASEEFDALQARYDQEATEFNERVKAEHEALWAEIYEALGIDPDGDYYIDEEYFDAHGLLFLKERERQPENPLTALLGKAMSGATEH